MRRGASIVEFVASSQVANIPVSQPNLGEAEAANVMEAMASTRISSSGPFLDRFEAEFAELVGVRHGIATSSGTSALQLALAAHGVTRGDEVILPSMTFAAVANAVVACGATPRLVDIDPASLTLCPVAFERAITSRTKAVIPVHLYGHPANMDVVRRVADRHSVVVIEDAAEAHGARYRGLCVGSLGDSAVFSFYGNKILTTGEGGMVLTDDDALASRLRRLRGQGIDPSRAFWAVEAGFNFRLSNVAAAIGLAQVRRFDEISAGFRRVAELYRRALGDHQHIELIQPSPDVEAADWLFTILFRESAVNRDDTMAALAARGIETRPVFPPLHLMAPFRDEAARCPQAERCAARGLSLPTSSLMSEDDVAFVVTSLLAVLGPAT